MLFMILSENNFENWYLKISETPDAVEVTKLLQPKKIY